MRKVNLVETEEFQAWRNGVYGFFEQVLYRTLIDKRYEISIWDAPDIYLLTMHDCTLLQYSSADTKLELEEKKGRKLGLFLLAEERLILGYRSEVLKSLLLKRQMEWHRVSLWSCMAAYHGAYESVARELRFVLEDAVQSLYADQQRSTDTIDEKIKWLEKKKNRLRGSPLIKATELPLDFESELIDLYNELCDYVHPSVELIQMEIENKRIYWEYIEKWFDKMFEFHTRVFDFILAIVMFRFPEAIKRFLEYQNIEELENDGYKNSIRIVKFHLNRD